MLVSDKGQKFYISWLFYDIYYYNFLKMFSPMDAAYDFLFLNVKNHRKK